MEWSNIVKELREKMVLTQEELAGQLEVAFATVNRYENGHTIPTIKVRRKILALCKKNHIEIN